MGSYYKGNRDPEKYRGLFLLTSSKKGNSFKLKQVSNNSCQKKMGLTPQHRKKEEGKKEEQKEKQQQQT